jgi:hypothetical protein
MWSFGGSGISLAALSEDATTEHPKAREGAAHRTLDGQAQRRQSLGIILLVAGLDLGEAEDGVAVAFSRLAERCRADRRRAAQAR